MMAHDWFDSLARFVGIVEWNCADEMVEDMGFDDAVEEMTTYETEFTVDSGGGSTGKVPCLGSIVRKGRIRVLEERDCNCSVLVYLMAL